MSSIPGVRSAEDVISLALAARRRRRAASLLVTFRSSERLFRMMMALTSLGGGVCARLSLIFRCDSMDTAWLGGMV